MGDIDPSLYGFRFHVHKLVQVIFTLAPFFFFLTLFTARISYLPTETGLLGISMAGRQELLSPVRHHRLPKGQASASVLLLCGSHCGQRDPEVLPYISMGWRSF